jgi:hypothetical protein
MSPADDPPSSAKPQRLYTSGLQAAIHRAKRMAASGRLVRLVKPEAVDDGKPLFPTAHHAVLFAGTREGASARPIASRMVGAETGARDLAGLDGAAQAGMILNVLEGLGRVPVAALIASAVPRTIPCSCRRLCCAGYQVNRLWREAMDVLCQAAADYCKAPYAVRWELLTKLYIGKGALKDIAKEAQLNEDTVGKYHKQIVRWVRGNKARNGESVPGLEGIAWADAETMLREVGIVG